MSLGVSTNTFFASTINALCKKAHEAQQDPDDYFTQNKQDFLEEQAKLLATHIPNASDKEQALFNFLDRIFQIVVTDVRRIKANDGVEEYLDDQGLWSYDWHDFNVLWMQDPNIEDLQLVDELGYQFSYEELHSFMIAYLKDDPQLQNDKTRLHAVNKIVVENLFRHNNEKRLQVFTGNGWTFPHEFPNLESKKEFLDFLLTLDIKPGSLMSIVISDYIPQDSDLVEHLLDEYPVNIEQVSGAIFSALLAHTNEFIGIRIPDLERLKQDPQSHYGRPVVNFNKSIEHIESRFPNLVEANYRQTMSDFFIRSAQVQKKTFGTGSLKTLSADEANDAHKTLIHLLEDIGF